MDTACPNSRSDMLGEEFSSGGGRLFCLFAFLFLMSSHKINVNSLGKTSISASQKMPTGIFKVSRVSVLGSKFRKSKVRIS